MGGVTRYAAFLRAINVTGRRATGAELRACVEAAGMEEVATFRNSGNVLFAGTGPRARVRAQVERALAEGLGFEVVAFLRTAAEVRRIAAAEPFPAAEVTASAGRLQVALLERPPDRAAAKRVLALGGEEDRLALDGAELYWLPRGGISDSPLDLGAIEAALGPMTMRTIGTVEGMAGRLGGE